MGINDLSPRKPYDPSRYKPTPGDYNPATEETQNRYYDIFFQWIDSNLSISKFARKNNLSRGMLTRIVKWVTLDMDQNTDSDQTKQEILEKSRRRTEKIEQYLSGLKAQKPKSIKDVVLLLREMRANEQLVAQLEGLISRSTIDARDQRKVVVNMGETIHRGEKQIDVSAKEIIDGDK